MAQDAVNSQGSLLGSLRSKPLLEQAEAFMLLYADPLVETKCIDKIPQICADFWELSTKLPSNNKNGNVLELDHTNLDNQLASQYGLVPRQVQSYRAALSGVESQRANGSWSQDFVGLSLIDFLQIMFKTDNVIDRVPSLPDKSTIRYADLVDKVCQQLSDKIDKARSKIDTDEGLAELGIPTQRVIMSRIAGESLGLQLQGAVNASPDDGIGFRVTAVKPKSPAAEAQLQVGDVVVAVAGRLVFGWPHDQVVKAVNNCGESIELYVVKATVLAAELAAEEDQITFKKQAQRLADRPAWNMSTTADCILSIPVDTVPFGHISGTHRDFDSYGLQDWHHAIAKYAIVPTAVDTTPLSKKGQHQFRDDDHGGHFARGSASRRLCFDTTAGDGTESTPRTFDSFGANDWSSATDRLRSLAPDASGGDGSIAPSRDYDAYGSEDWKGQGTASPDRIGPDTTPSDGSTALRTPRDIDSYGVHDFRSSGGQGGASTHTKIGLDTSGGDGSVHTPRDFESFGADDFKGQGGPSSIQPVGPDDSAGDGSVRAPRDYESLGSDDWRGRGGDTSLKPLAPDTSGGDGGIRATRDFDSYGVHDFRGQGGVSHMQPLGPDASGGGGSSRAPREYSSHGANDFNSQGGATTITPLRPDTSGGGGQTHSPRDYESFGPNDFKGQGGETLMKPLRPDASAGDGLCRTHRDFDAFGSDDWKGRSGDVSLKPLAPDTSVGDGGIRDTRDFDSYGSAEWRQSKYGKSMRSLGADTSEGDGSIRAPRDYEHFGQDDWRQHQIKIKPLSPDTSAGDGHQQMPRDIEANGKHGWNQKTGKLRGLAPDTTGGDGKKNAPRDFDDHGAQGWRSGKNLSTKHIKPDATPSFGSNAFKNHREFENYGKMDWNRGSSQIMPLKPDTTPSGSSALHQHRDHNRNSNWSTAGNVRPLAPDVTPVNGEPHKFRDNESGGWSNNAVVSHDEKSLYQGGGKNDANMSKLSYISEENWRTGGKGLVDNYADLRATDSFGLGDIANASFRPTSAVNAEDDWRITIQYEDNHPSPFSTVEDNSVDVQDSAGSSSEVEEDDAPGDWVRVSGGPVMTVNNPSFKKKFVVDPVLTTEEVRSFKFRELEKIDARKDWKPTSKKLSSDGSFGMPPPLERGQPYVDPLAPKRSRVQPVPKPNKAAVLQKLHCADNRSTRPKSKPKPLDRPNKNFSVKGRIGEALKKHDIERAKKKSVTIASGSSSLVQAREYNDLLRLFHEHRSALNKADELFDTALKEREAAIYEATEDGAELLPEDRALPKPKRSKAMLAAKRTSNSNRYHAKKTGAVRRSEYRELESALCSVKSAITEYRIERTKAIALRSKMMYAVHGFSPHACIVPRDADGRIGIQIQQSTSASVGFAISHIDESVDAPEMEPGDLIVEINGSFVLDSTYDEIREAFGKIDVETTFVLVRSDKLRKKNPNIDDSPSTAAIADKRDVDPDAPRSSDEFFSESSNDFEKEQVQVSKKCDTPYFWQVAPVQWGKIEQRREELLYNSDLTGNPHLMEEWLELLQVRKEMIRTGSNVVEETPTNHTSVQPTEPSTSPTNLYAVSPSALAQRVAPGLAQRASTELPKNLPRPSAIGQRMSSPEGTHAVEQKMSVAEVAARQRAAHAINNSNNSNVEESKPVRTWLRSIFKT